ncbi:hypothetical protein CR970_03525 [Candidatus Saccharibacteria bacterium]|nr:MAG: hypothetical protein CR970_03525 [Candidatus Saccharibacteria bacterium]
MERHCIYCGQIAAKQNDNLYTCAAGHENWNNPAPGVAVCIVGKGQILYGIRSKDPGKGTLDFPGGFMEVGESAEEAAIREVKEELGVDVTIERYFGTYPSHYNGERPVINIVFLATMTEQAITPSDDLSGGMPVWRSIDNLPLAEEVMDDWMIDVQNDLRRQETSLPS